MLSYWVNAFEPHNNYCVRFRIKTLRKIYLSYRLNSTISARMSLAFNNPQIIMTLNQRNQTKFIACSIFSEYAIFIQIVFFITNIRYIVTVYHLKKQDGLRNKTMRPVLKYPKVFVFVSNFVKLLFILELLFYIPVSFVLSSMIIFAVLTFRFNLPPHHHFFWIFIWQIHFFMSFPIYSNWHIFQHFNYFSFCLSSISLSHFFVMLCFLL